jgi:hypothetical protein
MLRSRYGAPAERHRRVTSLPQALDHARAWCVLAALAGALAATWWWRAKHHD